MPVAVKVLAQSAPSALSLTDIYTVPPLTKTTISTMTMSNNSGTATSFRVSIGVAGAADDPKQYIFYNVPLNGGDTFAATIGMTMGAGDVLRVYATNATIAFNVFGIEES